MRSAGVGMTLPRTPPSVRNAPERCQPQTTPQAADPGESIPPQRHASVHTLTPSLTEDITSE